MKREVFFSNSFLFTINVPVLQYRERKDKLDGQFIGL